MTKQSDFKTALLRHAATEAKQPVYAKTRLTPKRLVLLTCSTATKELLNVRRDITQPIVGKTYVSNTLEFPVIVKIPALHPSSQRQRFLAFEQRSLSDRN